MTDEKNITVAIYLPRDIAIKARVEAAKMNMSRSAFILEAVKRYLEWIEENARSIKDDTS